MCTYNPATRVRTRVLATQLLEYVHVFLQQYTCAFRFSVLLLTTPDAGHAAAAAALAMPPDAGHAAAALAMLGVAAAASTAKTTSKGRQETAVIGDQEASQSR